MINKWILGMALLFVMHGATLAATTTTVVKTWDQVLKDQAARTSGTHVLNSPDKSDLQFPLASDLSYLENVPPLPDTLPPTVFLAPVTSDTFKYQKAFQHFDAYLRLGLEAADGGIQPLNILPMAYMAAPYKGTNPIPESVPRQDLLHDAEKIGADYFMWTKMDADDNCVHTTVSITMLDLGTSRIAEFTTSTAAYNHTDILRQSIKVVANFCGVSNNQVSSSGMLRQIPDGFRLDNGFTKEPLYRYYPSYVGSSADLNDYRLVDSIPYFRMNLQDAKKSLKPLILKNPQDWLLRFARYNQLRSDNNSTSITLHILDLVHNNPNNLILFRSFTRELNWYKNRTVASKPPPALTEALLTMARCVEHYPRNWALQWDYAKACLALEGFTRGSQTVDKVSTELLELASTFSDEAVKHVEIAAAQRPDCVQILTDVLNMNFLSGNTDLKYQKEIIAKIHAVDPLNYDAELETAYSHSIGWTRDVQFVPLINEAIAYHSKDGSALAAIAWKIAEDLLRRQAFEDQPNIYYKNDPETRLLLDVVAKAKRQGGRLHMNMPTVIQKFRAWNGDRDMSYTTMSKELESEFRSLEKISLKQRSGTSEFISAQLTTATESVYRFKLMHLYCQQLKFEGKWDEAAVAAEKGIAEFPRQYCFYVEYGDIALSTQKNLEKALEYADKALDLEIAGTNTIKNYQNLKKRLKRTD